MFSTIFKCIRTRCCVLIKHAGQPKSVLHRLWLGSATINKIEMRFFVALPARLCQAESCNVFPCGQFGQILLLLGFVSCDQNPLKHWAAVSKSQNPFTNCWENLAIIGKHISLQILHTSCTAMTRRGVSARSESFIHNGSSILVLPSVQWLDGQPVSQQWSHLMR